MFAPFIPNTAEALKAILGQDAALFGDLAVQNVEDELGQHSVMRYQPNDLAGRDRWEPVTIKGGQPFNQPYPLIKKLDHIIVKEERARLGQ